MIIRQIAQRLAPLYGPGEAHAMAEIVAEWLTGLTVTQLYASPEIQAEDYPNLENILQRLLSHEPVQYVIGRAEFMGLSIKIGPGALIPRPETEELVRLAVDDLAGSVPSIIDIGTGSGCIALALKRNLPDARLTAIDLYESALRIAKDNALEIGMSDIDFRLDDILSPNLSYPLFDAIVSNPPYILPAEADEMEENVLEWEPGTALFVPENDPSLFYRAIASFAKTNLKPGGRVYVEINPLLKSLIIDDFKKCGMKLTLAYVDQFGKNRHLVFVNND